MRSFFISVFIPRDHDHQICTNSPIHDNSINSFWTGKCDLSGHRKCAWSVGPLWMTKEAIGRSVQKIHCDK